MCTYIYMCIYNFPYQAHKKHNTLYELICVYRIIQYVLLPNQICFFTPGIHLYDKMYTRGSNVQNKCGSNSYYSTTVTMVTTTKRIKQKTQQMFFYFFKTLSYLTLTQQQDYKYTYIKAKRDVYLYFILQFNIVNLFFFNINIIVENVNLFPG